MKTILVIGADPAAGALLKRTLERVGHLVVVVQRAEEGLSALGQFHVEVVIVDDWTRDEDGLAAIRAISRQYPRARVVAVANDRHPALVDPLPDAPAAVDRFDAARSAGAYLTLTRPFQTRELLKAVGCRVLVVDDEPDIRLALTRVLEKAGFEVSTASNGSEGLAHVQVEGAEMVITDIVMPRANGIELISALARAMPQIRIVAISGGGVHGAGLEPASVNATSAYLSAARGVGAHTILTKPFGVQDILTAVGHTDEPA